MNFYFQENKYIKKKIFIVNILLYLRNNTNILLFIFFLIFSIFYSLIYWNKSIYYKIICKNLSIRNSQIIIQKLINFKIPYKYSKISKSLLIPEKKIHLYNIYLKNINLENNFIKNKLFNFKKFQINRFYNKINSQDILKKKFLKYINNFNFMKNIFCHMNFYKNFFTLDACNKSFELVFVNFDIQQNIISEDFLDATIYLLSKKIPNFLNTDFIFLNRFGDSLNLKKNHLYFQLNYQNFYNINLIQNNNKSNIENFLFYVFRKKNTLDKITKKNYLNRFHYKNNSYILYKKHLLNSEHYNLFQNNKYIINKHYSNNHTLKENKKNYGTIIFSNYDQRYDIKKKYHILNFLKHEKYNFDFNKKNILNSINLYTSNLEDSNFKFDCSFKSNFTLDIGEITNFSKSLLIYNEQEDNENRYIFLVNNEFLNIKNLFKEFIECSLLKDDSTEIVNCNFIEPEIPVIPYIPITKNESFNRILHLVPWFILFFFIVLLITSFFSFKKLTKKIQDSNISIMCNTKNNITNSKDNNISNENKT